MWVEQCGELRRLVWLEQRLLCGAEAGPWKEGAQGWQVLEFKAGSGEYRLGCYFLWLL